MDLRDKRQRERRLPGESGGRKSEVNRFIEVVYDDLRQVAAGYLRGEATGHTLQPTALVHEAYLRLVDQEGIEWNSRTHFFRIGAQVMRRLLVEHARGKKALKRGGGRVRISFEEEWMVSPQRDADVLAVDAALIKLEALHPAQARIVELRFFGGMTMEEIATALDLSKRSVERHWMFLRAWLRRELEEDGREEREA